MCPRSRTNRRHCQQAFSAEVGNLGAILSPSSNPRLRASRRTYNLILASFGVLQATLARIVELTR
jgi:hypothetical protein